MLRALCLNSGEVKLFTIAKLEELGPGQSLSDFPQLDAKPDVAVLLPDFVGENLGAFEALGWVVQHGVDSLTFHRTLKNGKTAKTPSIDLSYEPIAYDLVFDGDETSKSNERPRLRPWVLRASGESTKTFAAFDKAAPSILEWARKYSPKAIPGAS